MQYKLADLIETFERTFRARVNRLSAHNQTNVTPFQAKVLLLVERNVGCSQQVVADWLSRDKAQIARTVKELETLNLVCRKPIKDGGRIFKLGLTQKGKLLCHKLNTLRLVAINEMLYPVSFDDQDKLITILSILVKDISKHGTHYSEPHSVV